MILETFGIGTLVALPVRSASNTTIAPSTSLIISAILKICFVPKDYTTSSSPIFVLNVLNFGNNFVVTGTLTLEALKGRGFFLVLSFYQKATTFLCLVNEKNNGVTKNVISYM